MEKFLLTLKNAKLRSYYVIRWLLLFLNITALYIISFSKPGGYGDRFGITGILLLSILLLFVKRKENQKTLKRAGGVLAINAIIVILWLNYQLYLPAVATLLFEGLFLFSTRRLDVLVNLEGITYPSFPTKEINWPELQNIILKDGILTIDFRNDKLIQQEIEENEFIIEKEFNEFCKQQLSK